MPSSSPPSVADNATIKVLMLHGYTQSGDTFRAKTRAIEKSLAALLAPHGLSLQLIYPTAPNRLTAAHISGEVPPVSAVHNDRDHHKPGVSTNDADADADNTDLLQSYGWYRHQITGSCHGLEQGMNTIATTIRQASGIDAVLGFSQGAAIAYVVAAALDPFTELPAESPWAADLRAANASRALRFAITYSGFRCVAPDLAWAYAQPLRTPTLLFVGSLDSVVAEDRTEALAELCLDGLLIRHPGGHFVPTARQWVTPVAGWIRTHASRAV